jgi:hypothetical protein
MKIRKFVTVDKEIEIYIDEKDIRGIVGASEDALGAYLTLLNECAQALKSVTDKSISEMSRKQRDTIYGFLLDQANRYLVLCETCGKPRGGNPECSVCFDE